MADIVQRPLVTPAPLSPIQQLASDYPPYDSPFSDEDRQAAEVLIRHLFAHNERRIDGIDYAVSYRLAEGAIGGDIVDIYHFDNGNVSLAIADISGKGAQAAIHAALVKYGLRCFASEGLTAERILRSLDRVYIENNAFERSESFASVFVGILDNERRSLMYASAGHEPVIVQRPLEEALVLAPTAPLIGVFDDQHHLFTQRALMLPAETLIVATTDGVTEARNPSGDFFGMARLLAAVTAASHRSPREVVDHIMANVDDFTQGRQRDDIAVFAVRVI